MHENNRADLERINRESGNHIRAARTSIAESEEHIRQSKKAIEQSLDLLKDTDVKG